MITKTNENINSLTTSEVPEGWQIKEIGEIAFTSSGGTPNRSNKSFFENGSIPWIKTGELKKRYIFSAEEYITEKAIKESSAKLIQPECVVIAMYGATIGQMSILKIPAAMNQACCSITPHENLDSEFLYYYLYANRKDLIAMGAGGAQPNISQQLVKKFKVLLPSLKEQQKIAEILSVVDEQIEKTEQLIEKTKELKKGLIQQLLIKGIGHTEFKQTELGEIPMEWEIKSLKELAHLITKGTSPSNVGFTFTEEGINFIKVESLSKDNKILPSNFAKISEECHQKLSRSILEENDLLISIAGTLGRTGIVKKEMVPANTNQALAIIRLKDIDLISFLYYFLQTNLIQKRIKDIATTGAQPNLSLKQIGDFRITLPSLKEQRKIVEILFAVDYQIETYKKEKEKQIELKRALMQQLLTGKLRVTV